MLLSDAALSWLVGLNRENGQRDGEDSRRPAYMLLEHRLPNLFMSNVCCFLLLIGDSCVNYSTKTVWARSIFRDYCTPGLVKFVWLSCSRKGMHYPRNFREMLGWSSEALFHVITMDQWDFRGGRSHTQRAFFSIGQSSRPIALKMDSTTRLLHFLSNAPLICSF